MRQRRKERSWRKRGGGRREERGIKGRRVDEFWSMPGGWGERRRKQTQQTEIKRTYFPGRRGETSEAGAQAPSFPLSSPIIRSLLLCLLGLSCCSLQQPALFYFPPLFFLRSTSRWIVCPITASASIQARLFSRDFSPPLTEFHGCGLTIDGKRLRMNARLDGERERG